MNVRIRHAGGVGDCLMFSSIIKEKFCKEYDTVFMSRWPKLFDRLYGDIENIIFEKEYGEQFNGICDEISLNFEDAVEHSSWRNLTYIRDEDEEEKLYQNIVDKVGKDYIIIHERKRDNVNRTMEYINREYIKSDLPIVNLDRDWLTINNFEVGQILDYRKVLRRANQIHVYEGSFMNLADSFTDGMVPLYGHLYCKPHYFEEKNVHFQIIKYIRKRKWHKNKWTYYGD